MPPVESSQSKSSSEFSPQGFRQRCKEILQSGESGLRLLSEAYLWAGSNLAEIHKLDPKYSQDWLRREIRRVWGIDVKRTVQTAEVLGGGRGAEELRKGFDLMDRIGTGEILETSRRVGFDKLAEAVEDLKDSDGVEEFREIIKRKTEDVTPPEPIRQNWRLRCIALEKQVETLKFENARLRARIADLIKRLQEKGVEVLAL